MNNDFIHALQLFAQALWTELLKARRSKVPVFTALGFSLAPLVGGLFMIILRDPEFARRAGLISAKAQLTAGSADWPAYLGFLSQSMAVGGLVVFGLVCSWIFGREYSDRTLKDLLALPTPRSAIILAKFGVYFLWSAALAALVCLLGLATATLVGLPPAPSYVIWRGVTNAVLAGCLAWVVMSPVAIFAGIGRGYLPPLGAAMLALALGQIIGILGWGEYFPWTIPALQSQGMTLGMASYVIVLLTGLVGVVSALVWWNRADQVR